LIPTYFLYQLAEYEGIAIEWRDLQHIKGIYTYTPSMSKPVIILSDKLHNNERKLRCVLSHELGHHFTTAGNHIIAASKTTSVYATKNELRATKWAVNFLIPTDNFLECIKEGMNSYELCNYFYVLPEFINVKSELVKNNRNLADIVSELNASYNVGF
jgi:Zn-dependent peptidase ImmA (M78 family)